MGRFPRVDSQIAGCTMAFRYARSSRISSVLGPHKRPIAPAKAHGVPGEGGDEPREGKPWGGSVPLAGSRQDEAAAKHALSGMCAAFADPQ